MDNIAINSTCVKVAVLLAIDKNYFYTTSDLLYHLVISDFYMENNTFHSKSIRNINSMLYYSNLINAVLQRMMLFNLIIIDGEKIKCSSISENLLKYYSKDSDFKKLERRMSETHYLCLNSNDIISTYNNLYNDFVKKI